MVNSSKWLRQQICMEAIGTQGQQPQQQVLVGYSQRTWMSATRVMVLPFGFYSLVIIIPLGLWW